MGEAVRLFYRYLVWCANRGLRDIDYRRQRLNEWLYHNQIDHQTYVRIFNDLACKKKVITDDLNRWNAALDSMSINAKGSVLH